MLGGSFFELKSTSVALVGSKTVLESKILINKNHTIFNGHFPGQPVVPGVCMIQIVKELLEAHLNTKLSLISASNIKFLSVINPEINSELNAEISFVQAGDIYDVDARLYFEETTFFKLKGNLVDQ